MTVLGCDWSPAQGTNIDAKGAAAESISFVWLKTAHGTGGDAPWLNAVLDNAVDAFEFVGGYIWHEPGQDPIQQAENVANRTARLISRALTPLPIMFDFEDDDHGAVRGQRIVDNASICIEHIEKLTGCRVLIYTGKWFMDAAVGDIPCPVLCARDLCHAEYPGTTRSGGKHTAEFAAAIAALPKAHLPKQWMEWRFRQFDGDKGLYLPSGEDSDFDLFAGTLTELRTWARAQWSWKETDGALELADGRAPNDPFFVDRQESIVQELTRSDTMPAPADTTPGTPAAKKISSQRLAAVKAPILGVDEADKTWDGEDPSKS